MFSVLCIHLSYGAWTTGPLESQMKSYILRAHKDNDDYDDDKGHKNNIWTFNSNPSNIVLLLHYKDLRLMLFTEIIAVYSKGHRKHAYTRGRQNTRL